MSSTYAGVTFGVRVESGAWAPHWRQPSNISVRHIPYSNLDDVQSGGRGNFRLEVLARVTSLANLVTLQSSVDLTARTLTLEGTAYTTTYLIEVGQPRRIARTGVDHWEVPLTFMRGGT